ncbi:MULTISPECIES: hypothetical protein [Leptospira]|uniref:Uncharacterized protein n=1 Tax=Leptospira bourretii TaxID=2484962 RepID=A0ABY2LN65_9LEPT|nr:MULTISPECIES: hypothetical protein [Leptospira]TGK94355.1 hypothetical protein EHQ26_03205 [Leptospira bourretii]TGL16844.1 hypothetical protein EHQ42_10980 [Leptospira levettii]TGL38824.1 hypothetical protein EHQ45_04440 [Leptospira bourretii]
MLKSESLSHEIDQEIFSVRNVYEILIDQKYHHSEAIEVLQEYGYNTYELEMEFNQKFEMELQHV